MASGGFGRGGRGAALLQALKDPIRKPGSQEDEVSSRESQILTILFNHMYLINFKISFNWI